MAARRVLMVVLDAYTPAIGQRMIARGLMPALARLQSRSACFRLDHGGALDTGLFGEHIGTGLGPELSGRHSAVVFDPRRYAAWQEGTRLPPFAAGFAARTVVLDPTYFDLGRAPAIRGLVNWGAHDPGTPRQSRPAELADEIEARFGPYRAAQWIYALPWPSVAITAAMRGDLVRALDQRADVAAWLLRERLPDWELAVVMASEAHSLSEGMWHGLDPLHPLHGAPSSAASAEAFDAVYAALDRFLGSLVDAFPDAATVVWCMHGMGVNRADLPSMILLPELLCRARFGDGLLTPHPEWAAARDGLPLLRPDAVWDLALAERMAIDPESRAVQTLRHALETAPAPPPWPDEGGAGMPQSIAWMPATRYSPLWPRMSAFALPAFLDGRVRINLAGRESQGRVRRWFYRAACRRVERLVRQCRDTRTGEPVVEAVEYCGGSDPRALDASAADLFIRWRGAPVGFDHPRLGRIGPVPYRRTGSHTGGHGFALFSGTPLHPGDHGLRSAFDVLPTVVDLLGETRPARMSGRSILAGAGGAPVPAPADRRTAAL